MTRTEAEYEGMRTHLRLAERLIRNRATEEEHSATWISMMYGEAIKRVCKGWTAREMADLWYLVPPNLKD